LKKLTADSKKIVTPFKNLKLCLAVKKEKDTRSLPTNVKNASEKTDTRKNNIVFL
jgi:hypothetical protein